MLRLEELNTDNPQNLTDAKEKEEPNLFDIMNEDVSEIDEEDPIGDEQIVNNEEGVPRCAMC